MSRETIAQYIGLSSLLAILIGLFFSRALMSIGCGVLFLNLLVRGRSVSEYLSLLKNNTILCALLAYYGIYAFSGLYSENTDWWLDRMLLKLPFLLVPLGILSVPLPSRRVLLNLLLFFVIIIFGSTIPSVVSYVSSYSEINDFYQKGKVLETPFMHIRYSITVVIASFICGILWRRDHRKAVRYIAAFIGIFAIVFVHILAVRTGLVTLYGSIILLLLAYIFQEKKYRGGIGLLAVVLASVVIVSKTVPSIYRKMGYTMYSIDAIRKGEAIASLSDSYRLASISAGIDMGKESPLFGVGIGDVHDKTRQYVEKNYPELTATIFTPQSQYVLTFGGLGIVGLAILAWMNISGIIATRRKYDLLAIYLALLVMLIVEQIIETQRGVSIFILTIVLLVWCDQVFENDNNIQMPPDEGGIPLERP